MGTGSFTGVKYGRGVLLTTHPLLVPRSWKSRAISLSTLCATPGLYGINLPLFMFRVACNYTEVCFAVRGRKWQNFVWRLKRRVKFFYANFHDMQGKFVQMLIFLFGGLYLFLYLEVGSFRQTGHSYSRKEKERSKINIDFKQAIAIGWDNR